jgi:D-tagatose-1,6-bisphosphate aldolase subunit GatZ/KbaZ
MDKANELVRAYTLAGYAKIHLDASMKCGDDDRDAPLPKEIAAARAAEMALAAEETAVQTNRTPPRYIIGTEVPIPGGAQAAEEELTVTTPEDVAETIEITRRAFAKRGLQAAWERVIGVVVQPGVEFGDNTVFAYDPAAAAPLVRFIEGVDGLVYEAHSTDYQTRAALRHLVRDHFAILKVGPGLTFAFREAVFALAQMEAEWLDGRPPTTPSRIREVLDEAMQANPVYWQNYYSGDTAAQAFARKYSFSDRSRYYWPVPAVQAALAKLLENLAARPLPLSLLSQYMPAQYQRIREGKLADDPRALILDKVTAVLSDYAWACADQ